MHNLEPFYNWRDYYISSEDPKSPFFGQQYSEFSFSDKIYNHYIHPQWDDMGSPTLYIKILFADYINAFAIIEMIGEWNDTINNDIMTLKRDIIDHLMEEGITKFVLIGENVLNIHTSDDCYYEEWYEDLQEINGWVCLVNFREHITEEMNELNLWHYINYPEELQNFYWRKRKPHQIIHIIEELINGKQLEAFQDYEVIS